MPQAVHRSHPGLERDGGGEDQADGGSLLVKEGDHYVAREEFLGAGWHVLEVLIGNVYEAQADLSKSSGFTLTYSSTADLWVQLPRLALQRRRQVGHQNPFDGRPDEAGDLPVHARQLDHDRRAGTPNYTFASALKEARGLLFVGKTPNVIAFWGMRIDGYVPMCR